MKTRMVRFNNRGVALVAKFGPLLLRHGKISPAMSAEDLRAELEELRARVDQMIEKEDAAEKSSEVADRVASLLKQLGADIRETKPGPLAAAFAAGFLMGKLSGR